MIDDLGGEFRTAQVLREISAKFEESFTTRPAADDPLYITNSLAAAGLFDRSAAAMPDTLPEPIAAGRSGFPHLTASAMQLIRFSRITVNALFLVAVAPLQMPCPVFGQPTISDALRLDSPGGRPFRNIAFVNSDEQGVSISSECTGRPKATGQLIGQNASPIGREIYPEGASPRGTSPRSTIMQWVVNYLDLPGQYDPPCIERGSPDRIAAMRSRNSHSKRLEMGAYDDALNTIYLPEAWTGKTPAEISILVHQMVYHVQNLAGLTYECSWERERLAYSAQEKWLRLHDSNLWESFGIDPGIFLLSAEYIC